LITYKIKAEMEDYVKIILKESGCDDLFAFSCGRLPQRISRATANFWLTGKVKQVLANQRRPWQHQCPLVWTPLADHMALFDPWEALHQCLPIYGQLAVTRLPNTEGLPSLIQASPMRPKFYWHSSGIYMIVSPNAGINIPQCVSDPNQIILNDILQYSPVTRNSHMQQ
jgi:hypothetical protein